MIRPTTKLSVVLGVLLSSTSSIVAQQKPEDESFTTADGVRLKGRFHRAPRPTPGNPIVILLDPPGAGHTMDKPGNWDGLTKRLNDGGFHVFRFDWRGHGRSTDLVDVEGDGSGYTGFWSNGFTGPWNKKYINNSNRRIVKNDLFVKTDVRSSKYFPVYVNDLAAARVELDGKNDQNDINTSSIYLIGAGDAATIGMLWMAAEWHRPAIHPVLGGGASYKVVPTPGIIVDPEAGRDIAGAIWLSADRPDAVREQTIANWCKSNLKLRTNNPMLFLYGDADHSQEQDSKSFFDIGLVARGNKALGVQALDQTFLVPIKSSSRSGTALLGLNEKLETEDTIMKYLEARQKDRVSVVRRERKYYVPYFVDLRYFGLTP